MPIDPVVESMLGQYRKDTAHVSCTKRKTNAMISMYYIAVVTLHKYIEKMNITNRNILNWTFRRIENHETRVIGMDGVEVICHTNCLQKNR